MVGDFLLFTLLGLGANKLIFFDILHSQQDERNLLVHAWSFPVIMLINYAFRVL
jgi:hypothetical protein